MGYDPYKHLNLPYDQSASKISDNNGSLRKVAAPYIEKLRDFLLGKGYLVMLLDSNGVVLELEGDKNQVEYAESFNVVPGADNSEQAIGTCAPAICLASGRSVQVIGPEHFFRFYHAWCCSAAPIFKTDREIIGSLVISNFDYLRHGTDLLPLAQLAARAVEADFKLWARGGERPGKPSTVGLLEGPRMEGGPVGVKGEAPGSREKAPRMGPRKHKPAGRDEYAALYRFDDYICVSPNSVALLEMARKMSRTDHTVLIQGESGTGKEVLAQAIHNEGPRGRGPFVAINCAAMPKELIQSELFGYEAGAFTGAHQNGRPGKFEQADDGTIFLDEIGDMPLEAQTNLLRVLQEKNIVRIGGRLPRGFDVRVIAATNKNLIDLVKSGHFRTDLYYRLSVINLSIPPLRERMADFEPIFESLVRKHSNGRLGAADLRFDRQAHMALRAYGWPGNIRQLENVIIHLLAGNVGGVIKAADLPADLLDRSGVTDPGPGGLKDIKRQAIEAAISKCRGNMTKAAKMLNISRTTLYRNIDRYMGDGSKSQAMADAQAIPAFFADKKSM
jgi:transcriptional regulator of acetoin/glycerol metabolism